MTYATEIALWRTNAAKQYATSEKKELAECFQAG